MSFIPSFKLYKSDGTTLQYTFEHVIDTNYPQDEPSYVELSNLRSQGAIIIPGGNKAWDLNLRGVLLASDYTALTSAMRGIQTAIVSNTRYILKIQTSISTYDEIKVMRLSAINFQGPSRRTKIQYYQVTFRADSW